METIWPNMLWRTVWIWPDPPHLRQVVTLPSFPPVPLQCSHTTLWGMSRLTFFPSRTSLSVISRSYLRDSPCWGEFRDLPRRPPPNMDPKMSPKMSLMSSALVKSSHVNPSLPNCCLTPSCPYWSYISLLSGSDSTSYASDSSLNFASATSLGSVETSGWYFLARLRYAFLISSSDAVFSTPRIS